MSVRTRFAPSPTGYLHVGGARTALYSWLYARHHQGQFILRIEDTDTERSTQGSIQAILDGMAWLGLSHDEGPFYQTQRVARYQAVLQTLLAEKKAYRCTCSKERLAALRETQIEQKQKPRYDGHCRDLDRPEGDEPFVIRFRNPQVGAVVFKDAVYGAITVSNQELDDLIIARSDGMPTYNFTVVVDDADMHITHVIRGDDHINNTPRQINLLQAIGAAIPTYAHLPMILGDDGKRLSKRHGAVSVLAYEEQGILPQALLNYLVRLGWSYGDQEIFSLEEMIEKFDLTSVSRSAAAFNTEKLLWLNQQYLKTLPVADVADVLAKKMQAAGIAIEQGPSLEDVVMVLRDRSKTMNEMQEKAVCFYRAVQGYDEEAVVQHITPETGSVLRDFHERLAALSDWDVDTLKSVVKETTTACNIKMPQLAQPVRIALTGSTTSPSLDQTLYLMGREETLKRLQAALAVF